MRIELPYNGYIEANDIHIGNNVKFGKEVNIKVRGTFKIGDDSYVGDRFNASGENIEIGKYFYNNPTDSRGMIIGGGSSNFPFANLKIGERCVCHTGHINLARPVTIGNDVGLSHDVDIITHGFWGSVLEGFPYTFSGVQIGNNVIVGWKTVIMSGVTITDDVVIGAHSTVAKDLLIKRGVYAGTPAKFIKTLELPNEEIKIDIMQNIISEFMELIDYYEVKRPTISFGYKYININNLKLDTENKECTGDHDEVTDAFRDFLRRYGLRFFHPNRPFNFNLPRKPL